MAAELLAGQGVTRAIPGLATLGMAGGRAAQIGGAAARLAASTALTPGVYLPRMMQENREAGRAPLDPRGLPAPFALGMIQNAIFQGGGRLTEQVSGRYLPQALTMGRGVGATAGRLGLRGATGLAEQQAADTLTTGIDRLVQQTTGAHLGIDTGYGTVGRILGGERDAWWHAASDALMFTAFAAIHEAQERPSGATFAERSRGLLRQPEGGTATFAQQESPSPYTRTHPLMEQLE